MSSLSLSQRSELQAMGMSDEQILATQNAAIRREQRTGPERLPYSVSEKKMSNLFEMVRPSNPKFEKMCGLRYDVFRNFVVRPMQAAAVKLKARRAKGWVRQAQLPFDIRVFRMLEYFRGQTDVHFALRYDQHPTTCERDVDKLVDLAMNVLVRKWVRMPSKDSDEYDLLLGAGVFAADFADTVLMAADMTWVQIPRPTHNQRFYWEGKHKIHALVLLTCIDGHGYTRYVAGSWPGSIKDGVAINNVRLASKLKEYDRPLRIS
jgi:hypothetical protein